MKNGEILTRLSNSVIQLHFNDLSSVSINKEDNEGIYFMGSNGKIEQINYHESKDSKIKIKIRKFSNIMEKISSHQEEEDEELMI